MCARTHILTSHQCIIIPKQTIINEPCNAYLSERRQPPPSLPLGWGCHSDRFIDIWRERGEGELGWRGGAEGVRLEGRQRRRGWIPVGGRWRSIFQMCLCVSSVNQPSVAACAQWGNSSWTFLNQVSVRRHLGCIFHGGEELIFEAASQPKKHKACRRSEMCNIGLISKAVSTSCISCNSEGYANN